MNKRKKIILFVPVIVFLIISIFSWRKYATSHKKESGEDSKDELLSLLNNENVTVIQTDLEDIEAKAQSEEKEAEIPDATTDTAKQEAVADIHSYEPVRLSDLYAEQGSMVMFQCFRQEAVSYQWEYYHIEKREWVSTETADIQSFQDEIGRTVSGLKVKADTKNHELMIKCTIHLPEGKTESEIASLYVLSDKIEKIAVSDITVDANRYISAIELPVSLTYSDGSKDEIRGLYGLYFLSTEESKEYTSTEFGKQIETITTITKECDYQYVKLEEQECKVHYHPALPWESTVESSCVITGKDLMKPVINALTISPFEVKNMDVPVKVTVSFDAEDNETPFPYLEYAFMHSDKNPSASDWIRKPSFDIDIKKNGKYIAYVRDASGNISTTERELVTVDMKAPIIKAVSLQNSGWCQNNKIVVEAKDACEILYYFENLETGKQSDWISYNNYVVDVNGTWMIRVKDTAGNISETEIVVSNIDKELPIIKRISIKGEQKNE